ncbi:MAG TPA: iron-containing alcohol dehydrogenase [Rubrobacteraceae bacterium]|nr:iron-containing alcohol dehydrogenase [Rubrobacteraceae bacterium]
MNAADRLPLADPTDLDSMREALAAADPEGALNPIEMRRIEIGPEAIELLSEVVSEVARGRNVVLVCDSTPILRSGEDLKDWAERTLGEIFEVRRVVIGDDEHELHADEEALAEVEAAVEGADCVVAVGSGTITDLCKEATARKGDIPLVVVQTAASVNAFAINMSVLLKSGVKRTGTSKWPDALLIDLPILAGAPRVMSLAGFGDLLATWTSPADWYLAALVGMDDSYNPAPLNMVFDQAREVLDGAAAVRRHEPEALEKLARCLALGGMAAGVIGKTAPLSGTEHLVSHLLDMNAGKRGLPFNFHGAQVGIATVPVAAAWEELFFRLDPAEIDIDACFPDPEAVEPMVRDAFSDLDPTGAIAEECWNDYALKLERWRTARPRFEEFFANWSRLRNELREMVFSPEWLGKALQESGAPARFRDLDPPVPAETAFWALRNCHLMRNRFTVADLLFFLGWWDDAFVEGLLERARSVGGGL